MIFFNQDISKIVTAMSFKLGQLIEDLLFYFLRYCPLQIFGIENK